LICKAADAGYSVIVVLAGMHNSLRSQTQLRLDEGFLGFDSTHNLAAPGAVPAFGVGKIDPAGPRPNTITTRLDNGDFKRSVAQSFHITPGGKPLLFVVKKNVTILSHLLDWVAWAANNADKIVRAAPLLVIDDEADHGSIDTRAIAFDENGLPDKEHDPTALNSSIRKLLRSFEQSAYVGYTATPFANIFIHEQAKTIDCGEDLFPRSFITSLPSPSNHIGPARVFGLESGDGAESTDNSGLPILRSADDSDNWMPPKHKKTHIPEYEEKDEVPRSLREAINSFVLSCAARQARGQQRVHNSMLIHVTRFVDVQRRVSQQVEAELMSIQNHLKHGEGGSPKKILDELKGLWLNDYKVTTLQINDQECTPIGWERVRPHLLRAALAIKVKLMNGSAGDLLDYEEHKDTGLSVIAIGGDKLSRGLTLEGLSVSYFLRASRMYDTLMQMGRWFGYRPGYLDLCRIYTTEELAEWFRQVSIANEELREEFDHMATVHGTPKDYGLRVRSHPGLLVTARVKMRHGISLNLSFEGSVSETVIFHREENIIEKNFAATKRLIDRISTSGIPIEVSPFRDRANNRKERWTGSLCWSGVPAALVRQFLNEYLSHPKALRVNCRLIEEYIGKQEAAGDLLLWTVLLCAGQRDAPSCDQLISGHSINLVERSWHTPGKDEAYQQKIDRYVIRRIVSPRDEAIDLDAPAYSAALKKTQDLWEQDREHSRRKSAPTTPGGREIRECRSKTRGLILLYPLDPTGKSFKGSQGLPVIGFAVSFPSNEHDLRVTYIVDNVYYRQEYGLDDDQIS
jgi:hypothetical protein